MKIIAISGDGMGAGKTFLAKKLGFQEFNLSLADCIRHDLSWYYPNYDWYNKTQAYKDHTIVVEAGKTVRNMMLSYGAEKRAENPDYWINSLIYKINDLYDESKLHDIEQPIFTVDDVRYLNEIEKLRSAFGSAVTHIHVTSSKAKPEPFDNEALRDIADYIIRGTAHA